MAPFLQPAILSLFVCSYVTHCQSRGQSGENSVTAKLGEPSQFQCSVGAPDAAEVDIWWEFEERNITQDGDHYKVTLEKTSDGNVSSELSLNVVGWDDEGTYTCSARARETSPGSEGSLPTKQQIKLEIYAPPKNVSFSNGEGKVGDVGEVMCTFVGRPTPKIKWLGFGKAVSTTEYPQKYEITTVEETDKLIISRLLIKNLKHADNGTYLCHGENKYGTAMSVPILMVLDKPEVKLDAVVPVGMDKLFFNWTVTNWNSPVTDYYLSYREAGKSAWLFFNERKIHPDATSFVMTNLNQNSSYLIRLAAKNSFGTGEFDIYHTEVETLQFDPTFIPEVSLKGLTWNSISIGWTSPPEHLAQYIGSYKVIKKTQDEEAATYHQSVGPNFYLFRNLNPATEFSFAVAGCNVFTKTCGPSSNVVTGTTEDGLSSAPVLVSMTCRHDNVSSMNSVDVHWQQPLRPGGQIEFYNITLTGLASYLDAEGKHSTDRFGPDTKTNDAKSRKTRFDFLKPNTNYTAQICAVTRRKECGKIAIASCKMRSTAPRREQLNRVQWFNDRRNAKDIFRLRLPKMSERNGRICCIRVVVVRMMDGQGLAELPAQESLPISSYRQVHQQLTEEEAAIGWGGYVAEILGPKFMGRDIYVGDGQNIDTSSVGHGCPFCHVGGQAHLLRAESFPDNSRSKRNIISSPEFVDDGQLDPNSNYTAFVEVIVPSEFSQADSSSIGRSPYMTPRRPGQIVSFLGGEAGQSTASTALISVLGILAGLVAVALFLLVALILLKRYSKQVAATQGGVEMDLRRSLRHLCNNLRRGRDQSQYLITPRDGEPVNLAKSSTSGHRKPVDLPSINKNDLVSAYLERHKDSDYGFQSEFELLPDGYPDRTHEICDRPHNRPKNRYPDIKCYDQTRVKLSPLPDYSKVGVSDTDSNEGSEDGGLPPLEGSDYINANFVNGYKNRKRWICAQGPLEHTVGDFWRMIYEQQVEMIIMLTNLEEYNRVKCAQYWPQAGDLNYLATPEMVINVRFCTEKRFSDYIVRELSMTVKTSKRGVEQKQIVRIVRHYHYLQWKDFNAPEHAPGMLHFTKRINEEFEKTGDRPIVVHCSAGVGRSGTLIAIDSLMQQLSDEGKVAIYKTVCDLRHYRNYLVQSVKQYMFVYRAIMEVAQFGDTEIESSKLKSTWTDFVSESGHKKLEEEFSRLSCIVDDRKALSVGTNEENHSKNQSESIIPYDRNRVILTPDGMKPHSTYINASFIEGYNNDESFIITQDPMASTVEDFWRMVVEHNICTMVQLTADFDEAFKYWSITDSPGSEASFGSMKITLDSKELLPSYIKREFTVYNQKCEEEVHLSHFAYSGWRPGDQVPLNTYGLLDLVEHALAHKVEASLPGPIAVHCKYGSDRSSIYVALSCLVQQLKTESRADVFTVVRKLRSQRQGMVQNMDEYQFIYRAISDYVDLYKSKDEEYDYSVPVNALMTSKPQNGTLRK